MQSDELREKLDTIKMWQRCGERTPHKPLLLLYALGRLTRGEPRKKNCEQIKEDQAKLFHEFGHFRQNHSPSYPFGRLSNEGAMGISGLLSLNITKNWRDRKLITNQNEVTFTDSVDLALV